jgi:hypothetical protein
MMTMPPDNQEPEDDELVLTPGGRRPRRQVHPVRTGEAVTVGASGTAGIVPARQRTLREGSRSLRADLALTPGGYRARGLVHRVEADHVLQVAESNFRLLHQKSRAVIEIPRGTARPGEIPGFGSGWIAYAAWTNTTGVPISSFQTAWRVPPAPATQSGQTIFLFNGIDPSDSSAAILQPVLQWGASAAGGGPYWSVASWYVLGSGEAFHTDLVQVNAGDELLGVMQLTDQATGGFSYASEFQGIPGTTLPVQDVAELVWCNETLEAYDITACSDYPDTDLTAMRNISLATGGTVPPLSWAPVDQVTDCGQHAVVASNSATAGEVDLYYRQPRSWLDLGTFAKSVQILVGVTNDGGGLVILPSGQIIHVPPHNPVFQQIAAGLMDVGRGFAVQDAVRGTSVRVLGEAIDKAGLELMAKGLEDAQQAVRKAIEQAPR